MESRLSKKELKESKKKQSDSKENLRLEIAHLKEELRLQRDRGANEEVVNLRNELRLAMEAEENSKRAMDEFALVIREVAAEANEAKEKLAASEEEVRVLKKQTENKDFVEAKRREDNCRMALEKEKKKNDKLQNTVDRLSAEVEESLLAWNYKEMEFVKCLKEEEDEKASLQEKNNTLSEELNELERKSVELKEDTEKLRDVLRDALNETEMAEAENSQLKDCLVENERKLAVFTQENKRLRKYEDASIKEQTRLITSSSKTESKPHSIEDEQKKLAVSSVKKETKPPSIEEKEQKKSAPSSVKKESKSSHGGEEKEKEKEKEKEQKRLLPSFSRKEPKSSQGGEEKEQKRLLPSFSRKETKSSTGEEKEQKRLLPSFSRKEPKSSAGAEEKDQKKQPTPSKKEHKSANGAEEKEQKKLRKDPSLDKDSKIGNTHHAKLHGIMCFDPKAMLPIPGISSKHKEVGEGIKERDDDLTDSIFDLVEAVESPRPNRTHLHRRTASSLEDEKSISKEEFEHDERPHLDDMEVERAGSHSTKKGVLLKKFGDLWKKKNQNGNLHQKEVTA